MINILIFSIIFASHLFVGFICFEMGRAHERKNILGPPDNLHSSIQKK
jgi:hypothetical protein